MEDENSLWTLESLMTTSRIRSQSALIAISIDTWQRNVDRRRKKEKQEDVLSTTRKDI